MIFDNGIWGPYNFIQRTRKNMSVSDPKFIPTKSQKIKNKQRSKQRGKRK